jgi:hypothetical protein
MKNQNLFPARTKNWHNSTTVKKVPPAHAKRVSTSRRTCICSILFFDSLSEYPFAIIAAGIFILVSGLMWLSHIKKNLATFTAPQSTWYTFIFDDILSFQAQEKRCAIQLIVGKDIQMHRYTTVDRGSQDHKEQIPGGLSQQTMMGPMKGLNETTGLWNWIAKIWKSKIFELL